MHPANCPFVWGQRPPPVRAARSTRRAVPHTAQTTSTEKYAGKSQPLSKAEHKARGKQCALEPASVRGRDSLALQPNRTMPRESVPSPGLRPRQAPHSAQRYLKPVIADGQNRSNEFLFGQAESTLPLNCDTYRINARQPLQARSWFIRGVSKVPASAEITFFLPKCRYPSSQGRFLVKGGVTA